MARQLEGPRFNARQWRDALLDRLAETSRARLLDRRAELGKLLAANQDIERATAQVAQSDDIERVDQRGAVAVLDAISAQERRELRDIDAALNRMIDGTWGTCDRCRGPIGLQRLTALPEARLCIRCSDA